MTIEQWNLKHPVGSTVTIHSPIGELEGREVTVMAPGIVVNEKCSVAALLGIEGYPWWHGVPFLIPIDLEKAEG